MATDWETPQDFFDKLNDEFHFELDVCATSENAKIPNYFSPGEDSLSMSWYGPAWMNPPYDKTITLWLRKAYEAAQDGVTVVALIQSRSTDSKIWHEIVMKASEIRFIKDRLHFGQNKVFKRANISNCVVVFRPFCQGPPTVSAIDTKGNRLC